VPNLSDIIVGVAITIFTLLDEGTVVLNLRNDEI